MTSLLEIRDALDDIPILDTHEHLLPPDFLKEGKNTLLRILKNSYLAADCISAGMDPGWWKRGSIIHGEIDLEKNQVSSAEDLDKLWPYLDRVKHTAYVRALMVGLEALHGLEGDLRNQSWDKLAKCVQHAYERDDWFDTVLERLKIPLAILDPHFMVAQPKHWSDKIVPDFHTDDFLDYPWMHPVGGKSAADISKAWGVELGGLDDLLHAINIGFKRYRTLGARTTKIGIAYRRDLRFNEASEAEARAAFLALQQKRDEQDVIVLGNYVVRHIICRSIEEGMAVQVHTGYQGGYLEQGCPTHLVNLFQEFPRAKFVLFHGGYPYADEAGLLAKTFPNVYVDLCWMPLLSPSMTVNILERWIDLVPHTKIMWGGDVWSVEECYGAVTLFRDVLARALWNRTRQGLLSEGQAIHLAERIMYQNAVELFNLEDRFSIMGG